MSGGWQQSPQFPDNSPSWQPPFFGVPSGSFQQPFPPAPHQLYPPQSFSANSGAPNFVANSPTGPPPPIHQWISPIPGGPPYASLPPTPSGPPPGFEHIHPTGGFAASPEYAQIANPNPPSASESNVVNNSSNQKHRRKRNHKHTGPTQGAGRQNTGLHNRDRAERAEPHQQPPTKKQKLINVQHDGRQRQQHALSEKEPNNSSENVQPPSEAVPAHQASSLSKLTVLTDNRSNSASKPSPVTQTSIPADATRSLYLLQEREKAKRVLQVMHDNTIGFHELVEEGLDAEILRALYAEMGIDIDTKAQAPPTNDFIQPSMNTTHTSNPIEELPSRANSHNLTVRSNASGSARESCGHSTEITDQLHRNEELPGLERKDYIARLMALKKKDIPQKTLPLHTVRSPQVEPPRLEESRLDPAAAAAAAPPDTPTASTPDDKLLNLKKIKENARQALRAARAAVVIQKPKEVQSAPPTQVADNAMADTDMMDVIENPSVREDTTSQEGVASHHDETEDWPRISHDTTPPPQLSAVSSHHDEAEDRPRTSHDAISPPQLSAVSASPREFNSLPGLFMTEPTASNIGTDDGATEDAVDVDMKVSEDIANDDLPESDSQIELEPTMDHTVSSTEDYKPQVEASTTGPAQPESHLVANDQKPSYAESFIRVSEGDEAPVKPSIEFKTLGDLMDPAGSSPSSRPLSTTAPRPSLRQTSSYQQSLSYQELQIREMRMQIEIAELRKKAKAKPTETPVTPETTQHARPGENDGGLDETEQQDRNRTVDEPRPALDFSAQRVSINEMPQDVIVDELSVHEQSKISSRSSSFEISDSMQMGIVDSLRNKDEAKRAQDGRSFTNLEAHGENSPSTSLQVNESWKKQRRAQIESTLHEQNAHSASNLSKLALLKAQMQELEEHMRKEREEKDQLIRELESLGVDAENIPEDKLQETRDEVVANLEGQQQQQQLAEKLQSHAETSSKRENNMNKETSSQNTPESSTDLLRTYENPEQNGHDDFHQQNASRSTSMSEDPSSEANAATDTMREIDSPRLMAEDQAKSQEWTGDRMPTREGSENLHAIASRSHQNSPASLSIRQDSLFEENQSALRGGSTDGRGSEIPSAMDMDGFDGSEDGEIASDEDLSEEEYSPEPFTPVVTGEGASADDPVSIPSTDDNDEDDDEDEDEEEYEPPVPEAALDIRGSEYAEVDDEDYEPPETLNEAPQLAPEESDGFGVGFNDSSANAFQGTRSISENEGCQDQASDLESGETGSDSEADYQEKSTPLPRFTPYKSPLAMFPNYRLRSSP